MTVSENDKNKSLEIKTGKNNTIRRLFDHLTTNYE